jgi:hypothetical protein
MLAPDDLDETELVRILAGWFSGVDDGPQIRDGNSGFVSPKRRRPVRLPTPGSALDAVAEVYDTVAEPVLLQ